MLFCDAAPGLHRVEEAFTNWYLLEGDGGLTIVDAGIPDSWQSLLDALRELGRAPTDVRALVLTHAHFDHMGFAERARRELGIPVYVHENDVALTRHPWRYDHERARSRYLLSQPKALPIVATFLRHRAFWPKPLRDVVRYTDGGTLPVPDDPAMVPTSGHTLGHCALHLADRDTLIAGDAIVTLDPYTGRNGPRLVAHAATSSAARTRPRTSREPQSAVAAILALRGGRVSRESADMQLLGESEVRCASSRAYDQLEFVGTCADQVLQNLEHKSDVGDRALHWRSVRPTQRACLSRYANPAWTGRPREPRSRGGVEVSRQPRAAMASTQSLRRRRAGQGFRARWKG